MTSIRATIAFKFHTWSSTEKNKQWPIIQYVFAFTGVISKATRERCYGQSIYYT